MNVFTSGGIAAERALEQLRSPEACLAAFDPPLTSLSLLRAGADLALAAGTAGWADPLDPALAAVQALPPPVSAEGTLLKRRLEWHALHAESDARATPPANDVELKPAVSSEQASSEWLRRLSPDPLLIDAWKRPVVASGESAAATRSVPRAVEPALPHPRTSTLLETVLLRLEGRGAAATAGGRRVAWRNEPADVLSRLAHRAGADPTPSNALEDRSSDLHNSPRLRAEGEEVAPSSRFTPSTEPELMESPSEPFTPPSPGLRRLWQAGLQSAVRQRVAAGGPPPSSAPQHIETGGLPLAGAPRQFGAPDEAEPEGRRFAVPGVIPHAATASAFPERQTPNEEDIAQTLAAILRREAERHGIDLDGASE